MAHVTGSRTLKVGYQGTWMVDNRTWMTNDTELEYRVSNGVPNQLTMTLNPYQNDGRAGWHAAFAQGQWTLGRATLQGAVALRPRGQLVPRADAGPVQVLPEPDCLPGHQGRRRLQRLHAQNGHGLRRLRQRQNGVQGELRQVPRGRGRLDQLRQQQPDAAHPDVHGPVRRPGREPGVDRRGQRLGARLQPEQPRGAGSARHAAAISAAPCRTRAGARTC